MKMLAMSDPDHDTEAEPNDDETDDTKQAYDVLLGDRNAETAIPWPYHQGIKTCLQGYPHL